MAARKTKSRKSVSRPADVKTAARLTGLSEAKVREQDAKDKKAGKKPLSFLAAMLDKTRKHVPLLEAEVSKRRAQAGK